MNAWSIAGVSSLALFGLALVVVIESVVRGSRVRPRFSAEYRRAVSRENRGWQRRRRLAFALSFGRDPLLPFLRAREVDHLTYRRLGRELPWIDVVPLHPRTHAVVTVLRRGGLRGPVNLVLRLAYGLWIAADVYAMLLVLALLHVVHGVPMPSELAARAHELGADVVRVVLHGAHLARAIELRGLATLRGEAA